MNRRPWPPSPDWTAPLRWISFALVLALLEFRLEDDAVPIKVEHRMAAEQVPRELRANGFRPIGSYDGLPIQHLLLFEPNDVVER